MKCVICNRDNPPEAAFCGGCAASLATSPFAVAPLPANAIEPQPALALRQPAPPDAPFYAPPMPSAASPPMQSPAITATPTATAAPAAPSAPPPSAAFPPNAPAVPQAARLFDAVGERVGAVTGVGRLEGFNAQEMFSSVMDKRTEDEIEAYFTAGTRTTTPALADVSAVWPKPWVFFRALTLSLLVYGGFYFGLNQFENINLLPGLIFVGSFAVPFSMVIFYFEMNVARNVSIYQVIKMLFVGGVVSLIATLFIQSVAASQETLSLTSALLAGTTEELGKLVALLLIVNKVQYRWTLNGLLFGGAVGAGFAGFESAGYALTALLKTHSLSFVMQNIFWRGLLSPGGHVAWAALYGAALWKVKGNRPFSTTMLQDPRFWRVLGLAMALHTLWDTSITGSATINYAKYAALIGIALIAVLGFIQDGLKQIQAAQAEPPAPAPVSPYSASSVSVEATYETLP